VLQSRRAQGTVRISARADYGLRAAIELAVAHREGHPTTTRETISTAQGIPERFLETILGDLRSAGLIGSQRGVDGGYWLARPPEQITVADVIRAVGGPLATVRGLLPEDVAYAGAAEPLQGVWIAVRAALRDVVEHVTLSELAGNRLPARVRRLLADPAAWQAR
jgi:Rrf2 family protein